MDMTPLKIPHHASSILSTDVVGQTSSKFSKGLIGYTCPYIPVEILSATGIQPYCLLHGDYTLMQQGTRYARIDACPLVRANLAHILQEPKRYTVLVGSTGCDMSRRMFDIIGEQTKIPIFLIHMPRTDNYQIFSDEIDWLISKLEKTFQISITDSLIREINKWEGAREDLRTLDLKRYSQPSALSTSVFHKAARSYYQGAPIVPTGLLEAISDKPRTFVIGSEISYESGEFLDLLEQEVRIVGDNVCGLSQFLNINIKEKTLDGIKHAYYKQPPCIYRRPNHPFHEYVTTQLHARSCDGVIGLTLDYCDAYEFELKRMEETYKLPLLRIRTDYAFQKINQLQTRVAAFGEMLCSKK